MKANELMIDDWVYNKNIDKPMQVYPMMISQMFRQRPDATTEDYNIFPISLTPEILEKNGFERHDHYQYIYTDNFCKVCVSFAPRIEIDDMDLGEPPIHVSKEGALFDIKMCISSIHQLQHALRLCGIEKTIEL